jgi:hypothetical protein
VAWALLILEITSFGMWYRSSTLLLQGVSIALSVVTICFCSLISFKLAVIFGLERGAKSVPRVASRLKKFDPKVLLRITNKAVTYSAGTTVPVILTSAFLPPLYVLPVVTVGLVALSFTILWRLGSQTPSDTHVIRFKRNLQCFLVLCLLTCAILFVSWTWYILSLVRLGLGPALIISSALFVSIVFVLLKAVDMSKQFVDQKNDPERTLFMIAYWDFEKYLAFLLFAFVIIFSDVPSAALVLFGQDSTLVTP